MKGKLKADGTRFTQSERKKQILETAMTIAEEKGYLHFSRQSVADRIGVGPSTINFYFNTADSLREAVLEEAKRSENLKIIAQACVVGATEGIPVELRKRAINHVIGEDG